jgi:hypothetical protein
MDSVILLLRLLKNSWTASGSGYSGSALLFTTNWYSDTITLPQITITNSHSTKVPKESGPKPLYYIEDILNVDVWYRPSSESNTSYGFAKNALFQIRSEVERIIRSGSPINDSDPPLTSQGIKNFFLSSWRNLTDTDTRPVIFRSQMVVQVQRYNEIDY